MNDRHVSAPRWLVVNADDLGQSPCINAGIFDAVEHGIVTSASMMVRWEAAGDAARWTRDRPDLGVGLHLDLGEWILRDGVWTALYEVVDTTDVDAVRTEVLRQLDAFERVMGRSPTHLDSHQHAHMREPVRAVVLDTASRLQIPVRSLTEATYCGDFYAQWQAGNTQLERIRFNSLLAILDKLGPGLTELACHPGADDINDLNSMYLAERSIERDVLCDPRLPEALAGRNIRLCNYATHNRRTA